MPKKLLIGSGLVLFCACTFLFYGCSSNGYGSGSSSGYTTTSTTVSSTTSTTLATGANTISGTVSWTGATSSASDCDVLVFTDSGESNTSYKNSFAVGSGLTSVAYTTSGMPNGTYYVVGVLYRGVTTSPGKPRAGDQGGEYSDGYVASAQSSYFDHTGAPQAVTVSGSGASGINYTLRATCTHSYP